MEGARPGSRALPVWSAGIFGIAVIGAVDYYSGTELRVFPLYYAPISLVAWYRGSRGALIAAALCSGSWFGSNLLAGLSFSSEGMWVANTMLQGASFATVGLLIAGLRGALIRERGLSRTDPLTSLLNSRAFYEEAARLLALCRRKGRPITVAYLDLDGFKEVNDQLGHQAGDELLKSLARVLRASSRPSDLMARLGGDEFAFLFPEVGAKDAAVALERLRAALVDSLSPQPGRVTGSIGGVTFLSISEDVEAMVRRADARMYAAKRAGKNRVCLEVVGESGGDHSNKGDEAA